MKQVFMTTMLLALLSGLPSCQGKGSGRQARLFSTSFESVDDFSGFYISPQGHKGSTFHELSDSNVHSGVYAHRAWVTAANEPSTLSTNNNHRGYPTIQLHKLTEGSFTTPCYIDLWVWLDIPLAPSEGPGEDDWFSFATFTDDESDSWARTVLVNLSHDGFVHLQHTPRQGQQDHIFQTTSIRFPQREWVKLTIYLDFGSNGYAKVWQNGELVSYAEVKDVRPTLAQAHFGMYCPPQIESGVVYNDDLTIREVHGE